MLVRDIMHSPVVTATEADSLAAAYEAMRTHGIRHLPVVTEGKLVGVVTDRDLRLMTSALHPHPFPKEANLRDVMTQHVVTTTPLEPVEEAARLMHEQKIGCLPVLEGERLTGIITGPDLLHALILLTGVHGPSGRIEVKLPEAPGAIVRLMDTVSSEGVDILSVLSYADPGRSQAVILRVNTLSTHALADRLRETGFEVTWPRRKQWSL